MARKLRAPGRRRIGRVSVYRHRASWWVYYRDGNRQVRRRIGNSLEETLTVAAQLNAQLAANAPTMLAFTPIGIPALRAGFLDHHEHVLRSTVATVNRYRSATQHLEDFDRACPARNAHEIRPEQFARYLNELQVAPNGHANSTRRPLRSKGIQYVLEVCRSMFAYAATQRHLPPYAGNPFGRLPIDKLKIEDAKPIFIFDAVSELAIFQNSDAWSFPIHFTLAKTGLRRGELVHLLIEDVDLRHGWVHVRNKPGLAWRVKTGSGRRIPLNAELISVLSKIIGGRAGGPVFLRQRSLGGVRPLLECSQVELEQELARRVNASAQPLSRAHLQRVAKTVWRDAGAIKADMIRTSFVRIIRRLGRPDVTCPKSFRHTFATLQQDANVDPLIRQQTLGHRPSAPGGLGMTAAYTHSRPETQRDQIEAALRLWPQTLELARSFCEGALDE